MGVLPYYRRLDLNNCSSGVLSSSTKPQEPCAQGKKWCTASIAACVVCLRQIHKFVDAVDCGGRGAYNTAAAIRQGAKAGMDAKIFAGRKKMLKLAGSPANLFLVGPLLIRCQAPVQNLVFFWRARRGCPPPRLGGALQALREPPRCLSVLSSLLLFSSQFVRGFVRSDLLD